MAFSLLTKPDANPKIFKNLAEGYATFAMHLAPATLSGHEVCPSRSPGCTAGCLNISGLSYNIPSTREHVQRARILRTKLYFADREAFMEQLYFEIVQVVKWASKRELNCAIRLNATSDIPWHRVPLEVDNIKYNSIIEAFPEVQFYDYTKVAKRMLTEELPRNYHLTFSLSENNIDAAYQVAKAGKQVAMVFRDKASVKWIIQNNNGKYTFSVPGSAPLTVPIVDGEKNDLRFRDPAGCIVALSAKGRARDDRSGFVRDL